jgi:hypothetical protein
MSGELLPQREVDNAEHIARALLWAMNDVLGWDAPHPQAGLFRSSSRMSEVCQSHGGNDDKRPSIDFDRYMVSALFMVEGPI